MGDERHTKFMVSNKKDFLKTLYPNNGNLHRKIGLACRNSAEQLCTLIQNKKGVVKYEGFFCSSDNIYKNIELSKSKNVEFTVPVLNTFLSFFFYKKDKKHDFKEVHTIENLRDFFNHIKIRNHKKKDRDIFHQFIADIKLIKEDIVSPFNEYNLSLNANWEFVIEKNKGGGNAKSSKITSNEISSLNPASNIQNTKVYVSDFAFSKIYPKKLNVVPMVNPRNIIGRDQELKRMYDLLFNEQQNLLIKGMGGIGKTTIASCYVFKFYDYYEHILWISLKGNGIMNSIIESQDLISSLNISTYGKEPEEILSEILMTLKNISKKPKLLILDNAKMEIESYLDGTLPSQPNWHVVYTSTENITGPVSVETQFLPLTECLELFKSNCNFIKADNQIEELIKVVGYHTLTIEILSKTCQRKRLNFERLIKAIELNIESDVKINHSKKIPVGKIKTYLSRLFTISDLSTEEIWMVKQFLCLPSEFHSFSILKTILYDISEDQNDSCSIILENLAGNGWILKNESNDSYKMHNIIIDILKEQIPVEVKDIEFLILHVKKNVIHDPLQPFEKMKWIPFARVIENNFNHIILNHSMALFRISLANTLMKIGESVNAKQLYLKTIRFYEESKTLEKTHPSEWFGFEDFKNIRESFEERTTESLDPDSHKETYERMMDYIWGLNTEEQIDYINCIKNLADIEFDIGNEDLFIHYYKKVKSLCEELFESRGYYFDNINQTRYIEVLFRLGFIKKGQEIQFQLIQVLLKEENTSEEHLRELSIQYYNFFTFLEKSEKYDLAREMIEKAITIIEKINGEEDWRNLKYYSGYLLFLFKTGEKKKVEELAHKIVNSDINKYLQIDSNLLTLISNTAVILCEYGDYDSALAIQKKIFEIDKEKFGLLSLYTGRTLYNLSITLLFKKKWNEAMEYAQQAKSILINFPKQYTEVILQDLDVVIDRINKKE